MDNKGYRCLVAGALVALVGAHMGMLCQEKNTKQSIRSARAKAARFTSRASREAGHMISTMGERLANRIR